MENLLNRVLDDTVRASAAIIAAVEETLGLLPTLVAALSNPHIVTPAVDELVARCRALADPNTATTEGSGESVMDTTLFEIFARESATHLDAIEAYLAHAADTGARAPDESLLRALHTLHGSASLAQVESIAHIAGEAGRFCKDIVAHGAMFGDEALAMLGEVVACCRLALEHLFDPTAQINCGALVARIHALPQPATATAEVDAELLELFLEEGVENLNACDEGVTHWLAAPRDLARVEAVQRALHTLKGGARMANLMHMGDLCHELESLLAAVAEGALAPSDRMFDTLHIAHDRLLAMLEQARKGVAQSAATDLLHEIEEIRRGIGARAPGEVAETSREDAAAAREAALAAILAAVKPEADAAEAVLAPVVALHDERRTNERTMQEQVRVRADVLDALVNHTGEVSIYRARLAQQMGAFRFNLNELTATVARLKEQLRRMEIETEAQIMHRYESAGGGFHAEFDPLELDRFSQMQQLSRGLQETAGDVTSLQGLFENLTRESETLLDQQSRVVTDIQENLLRARMVPFGNLAPRLRRVVRQACMELGKRAELVLVGAEGELDRSLIDHIVAPLEHLLRNAVAHGIEAPAVRRERGKSEVGRIDLTWARDGGEVVLTVSDDGAGIDHEAIRAKARERGLIAHDTQVSDHEALQFILESGFSTASEINQVAGRGVGMDVVNNEVRRIGGALEIESERGRGARFGIRLPFTLAINRALLVAHGEELYALPLASVDGIARLPAQALERHQREGTPILHAGQEYPVQSLGMLLGTQAAALGNARHVPVVLVKSGTQRAAWPVDSLMGNREVVVKSVGGQLATVRGVSGATILGDGRVVLILEAGALLRMGHARGTVMERFAAVPAPRAEANGVTVLVVDDSITVRKVTTRLLERNNITVLTAKDGMDAVSLLHEHVPDVILTDIEMPRMDGYELATYVRNDSRLRHVPIVMITSRTGDKHRNRAFEIGVNRYLGKPYQEHQLIEDIHTLVAQASGHA